MSVASSWLEELEVMSVAFSWLEELEMMSRSLSPLPPMRSFTLHLTTLPLPPHPPSCPCPSPPRPPPHRALPEEACETHTPAGAHSKMMMSMFSSMKASSIWMMLQGKGGKQAKGRVLFALSGAAPSIQDHGAGGRLPQRLAGFAVCAWGMFRVSMRTRCMRGGPIELASGPSTSTSTSTCPPPSRALRPARASLGVAELAEQRHLLEAALALLLAHLKDLRGRVVWCVAARAWCGWGGGGHGGRGIPNARHVRSGGGGGGGTSPMGSGCHGRQCRRTVPAGEGEVEGRR